MATPLERALATIQEITYPHFKSFELLVSPLASNGSAESEKARHLKLVYDMHLSALRKSLDEAIIALDPLKQEDGEELQKAAVYKLNQRTLEALAKIETLIIVEYQKISPQTQLVPTPVGRKRKRSSRYDENVTRILEHWWSEHLENPYPTEQEKENLSEQCGITMKQVSTWFANKRARDPDCQSMSPAINSTNIKSSGSSGPNTPGGNITGTLDPEDLFKDIDLDINDDILSLDNWNNGSIPIPQIPDLMSSDNMQWLLDD